MSGLREVWPFVDAHHRAGRPVVLARLVGRDGPGARPIGAIMAELVALDHGRTGQPLHTGQLPIRAGRRSRASSDGLLTAR